MEKQNAIKGLAYITKTDPLGSLLVVLLSGAIIDTSKMNALLMFATMPAALKIAILLLRLNKSANKKRFNIKFPFFQYILKGSFLSMYEKYD